MTVDSPLSRRQFVARTAGYGELSGAGFSADGRTRFFNIYTPGITYAITGPWRRRR
ncbi:MAG: uncharacterized protein QOH03_2781 [Kribbellaceae bacterium]|nr:uncharacterized protein [Kribbellaceae bacterium]